MAKDILQKEKWSLKSDEVYTKIRRENREDIIVKGNVVGRFLTYNTT